MIEKPTLVVHTTYFPSPITSTVDNDPEHLSALRLGEDLYSLLTRAKDPPLAWGAGIPVRVATRWDRIDSTEAKHVVVIPVLGQRSFADEAARRCALEQIAKWNETGVRILPVPVSKQWRNLETKIPKPLLTELYAQGDPRHATLNEILLALARVLSSNDSYSSRLFISHAKADLEPTDNAAERIRSYISSETTGAAFFDKVSILPGEDLTATIDRAAGFGVFIAIRGDHYSSRLWCRRELLIAKQQRLPTLTVEVLSSGESRSATYAGNGPTLVWERTASMGKTRACGRQTRCPGR